MKLLVLADIHRDLNHLFCIESVISECDGIIIAGDITDFGGDEQARFVISTLTTYGKPLLAVPGNCDLPGVEDVLQKNKINLHGNKIDCGGLQFVGVGGSLPCPGTTPNEACENDFRDILEKGVSGLSSQDNLVLVTHQPAWGGQLDIDGSGRHTGSRAVREFIEQHQPILAISGHMHEAYGTDKLGATVLINPGPFRQGRYAVVEIKDRQIQIQLCP
ncbi:MAG: metallophosphoesterase [Phycisphaerae bacterium]|nr:metallophosphoesterase [Phycisphaerae bacterium]